jgi:hypothetical protein
MSLWASTKIRDQVDPFEEVARFPVERSGVELRARGIPRFRRVRGARPVGLLFSRLECGKERLDSPIFERRLVCGSSSLIRASSFPDVLKSALDRR